MIKNSVGKGRKLIRHVVSGPETQTGLIVGRGGGRGVWLHSEAVCGFLFQREEIPET